MSTNHHSNDDHHAHGIAHVASAKSLLTTWGLLMVLTVVTVGATKIDLGGSTNLALGMAIAAIKATLVVLFFMHLRYDKIFHSVLLFGALAAGALFVTFTLMDTNQYNASVHWDVRTPLPVPDGPRVLASPPP